MDRGLAAIIMAVVCMILVFWLGVYLLSTSLQAQEEPTPAPATCAACPQMRQRIQELETLLAYCQSAHTYQVRLTAYTARPQETNNDPTNTALMERPVPGWTMAVSRDLQHLLGHRVYIEGFGVRRVNDLMNSRFTNAVDILVGTPAQARKVGVRKDVQMTLIDPKQLLQEVCDGTRTSAIR